jgi:hypothetical protein
MNLHRLAKDAAIVASANGFDQPTWENLPIKVMLVVTEVVEAINAKDDAQLLEEFADIALRTLAILECCFDWAPSRIEDRNCHYHTPTYRYHPMESLLFQVLNMLAKSVEAWRREAQSDACLHLELALLALWRLADVLNFDLCNACLKKLERNRTREHLHGVVRSEG